MLDAITNNFLFIRLLRKLATTLGYKIDFLPLHLKDTWEGKAEFIKRITEQTKSLPGAVIECGVGNGFSFALLSVFAYENDKDLYGFDSFEGFPEPSKEDDSPYEIQKGNWSDACLKNVEEKVLANVPKHFVDSHVKIRPGFFQDTLPSEDLGPICFLHVDVDLYQSYLDCFEHLYGKVVPGGIIAIDEYLNGIEYAKYPGGFKATEAFFSERDDIVCRDIKSGKYYIIKK